MNHQQHIFPCLSGIKLANNFVFWMKGIPDFQKRSVLICMLLKYSVLIIVVSKKAGVVIKKSGKKQ